MNKTNELMLEGLDLLDDRKEVLEEIYINLFVDENRQELLKLETDITELNDRIQETILLGYDPNIHILGLYNKRLKRHGFEKIK